MGQVYGARHCRKKGGQFKERRPIPAHVGEEVNTENHLKVRFLTLRIWAWKPLFLMHCKV